jgi:hypothetical protein
MHAVARLVLHPFITNIQVFFCSADTFLLLCAGSTVTAGESFDCFSNFASDTFHGLDFLI